MRSSEECTDHSQRTFSMRYAQAIYMVSTTSLLTLPQRFQALGCKRAGLRQGATG